MPGSVGPGGPEPVVVGRLGRPHGLRGEFLVDVRTDVPERRFAEGNVLDCTAEGVPTLTVASSRRHSGRWIVRFVEVTDRTAADVVKGAMLTIAPDAVGPAADPDDPDDEAWWDSELVGLAVVTEAGQMVGVVRDVLHPPGGDVLAVQTPAGGGDGDSSGDSHGRADADGEVLVPFVAEFVPTVDVPGGRIVIAPPEGLLDL